MSVNDCCKKFVDVLQPRARPNNDCKWTEFHECITCKSQLSICCTSTGFLGHDNQEYDCLLNYVIELKKDGLDA